MDTLSFVSESVNEHISLNDDSMSRHSMQSEYQIRECKNNSVRITEFQ
jgi:hypothetical protein